MEKRRVRFWLLALPAALMAVLAAFVAANPNDPFADFGNETFERVAIGPGQVRTTRNIHADFRRLADLHSIREGYVASTTPNHDALVLRSRDPNAAIPLIVLRPGRRFDFPGKIVARSFDLRGVSGTGWTRVEVTQRTGLVASAWNRIDDALHPRPSTVTTMIEPDASSPNGMGVTAYLARRNFR